MPLGGSISEFEKFLAFQANAMKQRETYMTLVLGNISIFWEYRDISLDNIIFHIVDILGYRNIVFQHLSYLSSLRMLKMKYIVWICIIE